MGSSSDIANNSQQQVTDTCEADIVPRVPTTLFGMEVMQLAEGTVY
jgi:hypothetical protein